MRYWKVLAWTIICVVLLTVAQFGSVHLLTDRPESWLFEASLDLAPPLLFAGDIAQLMFTQNSQAPLRNQLQAVGIGVLVNICMYAAIALVATWLFFPPRRQTAAVNAATRRK
jgi:hypothetical protein